ncbi:phytoene/squalene synthase family protein [Leifsonia sp. Root112D2]|uniref:phytoene/squalene synthase family protein n=1 Tax=Leifsonia sp. Root112D2 TaxID=1736426 RepID=UPI0006F95782|nr:phytoene/squalene synthase family protein [Leifsonia sp. Root112D2]KQV06605.1 phytoene synthase [Leifsonia sp. Root112D2]
MRSTSTCPDARESTNLGLYTRAAEKSSARVIREYSTSFTGASRLLDRADRPHIENIYALVRIADEVVDGAAQEAGLNATEQQALLDALEAETERAVAHGYSTNLVVHGFATTARASGIDSDLTAPFFRSMRRDLSPVAFTEAELREYIYGSAEVVGLMCLRVFLRDTDPDARQRAELENGARRLGSAFQKINFLRDLSTDWQELGRSYFPGVCQGDLTESHKRELVADIEADLAAAAVTIPLLPQPCRRAVRAAHDFFAELTHRIRRTPVDSLMRTRVRVPAATRVRLLARVVVTGSERTPA